MTTSFLNRVARIIFTIWVVANLTSCLDIVRGSGDTLTETRNETNFHALDITIPGRVEVRIADSFSVEITCEENIIDYIETEVDNGVLKINFDRNVYDVDDLVIKLTAPSWDAFEISGSCDVEVKDSISGDELVVDISGSGNLRTAVADFNTSDISISGSGDVFLKGSANEFDCSVSGSGNLEAFGFQVKTAKANVSGSGDVEISVSDNLDATVSGSGSVRYKGDPVVNKNVSGSGTVKKV
jgi:hypothetical protein